MAIDLEQESAATGPNETEEALDGAALTCPISGGIMKDPVMLLQSCETYDKQSICESLLKHPDLCPATGNRYSRKLLYADNLHVRKHLPCFEQYEDSQFTEQYDKAWEQLVMTSEEKQQDKHATTPSCGISEARSIFLSSSPTRGSELSNRGLALQNRNNYWQALECYELAASLGNAAAQNNLGVLYFAGNCVDKDYNMARKLSELAAANGNEVAQNNLGVMYHFGFGVDKDYGKARAHYEMAKDIPMAQNCLGVLHLCGHGVDQDFDKAREYFELASAKGSACAAGNLGHMYQSGLCVEHDYSKAREYYELADVRGYKIAKYFVASLYLRGLGVAQDVQRALGVYEAGAKNGCETAQRTLLFLFIRDHAVNLLIRCGKI